MTVKRLALASTLALGFAMVGTPAFAAVYTLSCVDSFSGQKVTVDVEASSRAAAIKKVRNDPAYSNYDKCK